jgi:hypothetical protein
LLKRAVVLVPSLARRKRNYHNNIIRLRIKRLFSNIDTLKINILDINILRDHNIFLGVFFGRFVTCGRHELAPESFQPAYHKRIALNPPKRSSISYISGLSCGMNPHDGMLDDRNGVDGQDLGREITRNPRVRPKTPI